MKSSSDETDQKSFVSRRGKQVGVHEVDLKGIDIETDQQDGHDATPEVQPSPQTPRSKSWSRKKVGIVVACFGLLVTPIVLGELVAAEYDRGSAAAKNELRQITSQTVLPMQKSATITSKQVSDTAKAVDDITGKMCRGGMLDNASSLYPRAGAALTRCKQSQSDFAALVAGLKSLESAARYLEQIDIAMKPAATPVTDGFAVLSAQHDIWKDAAASLNRMSPPQLFAEAHREIYTHVSLVSDNWLKLTQAHNAQDGTVFTETEKALAAEYEAVRNASSLLRPPLLKIQADITGSYDALGL